MCWNEPSTLRLRRLARESVQVAARLTKMPTSATASTRPPLTSGGAISRRTASNRIRQREHQQRHAVGLGREDLDALEPVGHDALRGAAASRIATSEKPIARRVREHVTGVREQRERAGEQAGDDLEEHEAEDQREGDGELAAVGVGGHAVRVSLVAPMRVGTHAAFTNVTVGRSELRGGA